VTELGRRQPIDNRRKHGLRVSAIDVRAAAAKNAAAITNVATSSGVTPNNSDDIKRVNAAAATAPTQFPMLERTIPR
jgi:hypothetical protein